MREEHVRMALAQLHEEFKFSDKELEEYKEMLNRNLANKVCINEAENLRSNIALVESSNTVQIPTLFLISNGEGTTQKSEVWRNNALNYLKKIKIAEYKLFDYPHNLYKFASKEMAKAVCEFLSKHIR